MGHPSRLALAGLAASVSLAAACGSPVAGVQSRSASSAAVDAPSGGNPQQGQEASRRYGCVACHIIPGVPGGSGHGGPSLDGFARRPSIADAVPNTPEHLVRWIQQPAALKPDTAMPALGVPERDARDIAAYLATLE